MGLVYVVIGYGVGICGYRVLGWYKARGYVVGTRLEGMRFWVQD